MIRRITILHLLFFSLIATFSQAPFPIKYRPFTLPADADFMPGKVIVKFADNYRNQLTPGQVLIPEIQTRLSWLKTTGVKKLFPQAAPPTQPYDKFGNELVDLSLIYEVDFQSAYSVEDAVNLLMTHPGVVYAEPRYVHRPFYLPNDPLADTTGGQPGMWHLGQISALEAWDIQRGDTNIIIAIVDAGTYFKHDDLKNNLAKNHDDPIDGLDNDQDGYIDNYRGWDFGGDTYGGPPDNNPSIGNVHGLWVAGTACAEADNQLGVAGVSFNCRYLPIKAAADDSLNSISHGYEGIVYAADYGAQIINASWGNGLKSFFGQDVVRYATFNRSAVVIAAAGNSGTDRVYYPAAYREAISVASSRFDDEICCALPGASGNTTFHHSVDVSAPGWKVASIRGEDQYWSWSGTSAAAPVVAGALGIVKARFPQMTGFQAAQRLRVMADDIYQVNPAYMEKLGYGRINMERAVSTISRPAVRLTGFSTSDLDGDGKFSGGDTLVIKINFINYLDPTQNLIVDISASFPFVEVIEGNFLAGAIGTEKSFSSAQTFKIRLDEQVPPNFTFEIRIGYEDEESNYLDYEYIDLRVNRSWIDITQNHLFTSLNSQGNFGFDDFGNNQQGIGVIYNLGTNALFEGGFLIGNSETQVSDRIRNSNSSRDNDFSVVESVRRLTSDSRADFVARTIFNDQNAANSLGIEVTNHAYAFRNSPNHDFIIIEYIVENKGAQPLDSLYGGLFADWDISVFADPVNFFPTTKNASDFDVKSKLVFAYDRIGLDPNYYGLSMISDKSFHAFAT
ncbi:MAG: S8 family serine peptidase, partial [Bacteroidetes bacterium]|nr:S8 family serine peptidase [Bacteroidota bacterium]